MTATERCVVIGGDAAGMSAASQARKLRGADDLAITVFERGGHTSYAACGIPYAVGGDVPAVEDLVARTPEQFARRDIDVRLHHEVVGIDVDARTVTVRDLDDGAESTETWDQLVIGTGASPLRPPLPGIDADGVFAVRTLDDADAILAALADRRPSRAVVVGSGYIGLEMAEAFAQRGLAVSVVDMAPQPMTTLDADMGALVADALRAAGVDLRLGTPIEGFDTDATGAVRAVRTADATIDADLVVLGMGARPNGALAALAGIDVGASGGITVDRLQRTSAPGVWAAGDCTEVFHRVTRRPAAIALGTHANKQGRACGINIGGGYATFEGVVGTAITKFADTEIARTGLGTTEAARAGFDAFAVHVDSHTRAGYYPGAEKLRVKVVAETRTGRLLGAQIVGGPGSAKRIDVFATALWNEMTVEDVAAMDLSYAPPFAPVWDPVLIAARKAAETLM